MVGTLLVAINHGNALGRGDVSLPRVLRMLLTVLLGATAAGPRP